MRFHPTENGVYNLTIAIPPGFSCERCVLQWRYYTGNSWGVNPDGKQCIGCGLQEQFQNCADIRIGGSIPEPMQSNKLYKEMGWLDFKQQIAGSKTEKIKTAQADVLRIQTTPFAASTLNSTTINVFDNIANQIKHIDGSTRLSTLESAGVPILFGGMHMSNDRTVVSSDIETVSQLKSNNQNNLITESVNSVLGGKANEKKAQPDFLNPNRSHIITFDKSVETKQNITEIGRLLVLSNINADQSFNGNLLDATVSKPVENDIYLSLQGRSGGPVWPSVKEGKGNKPSEILNNNSLTPKESDGSTANLSIVRGRESHISPSIEFDSNMPRHFPGLKSESLGPTNVLLTLDLTKVSTFDSPFVRPMNTTTSKVKDPRTGLTIQASSRPGHSSAPLLPQEFDMLGFVQRDENRALIQPSLTAFQGQQGMVSEQVAQVMLSVVSSRNDSAATGVPSATGFPRTISQLSKTDVSTRNSGNLQNSVPGGSNPLFQNSGTGIAVQFPQNNVPRATSQFPQNNVPRATSQFPQNNVPSATSQFPQDAGPGRNVITPPSVAPRANGQSPPTGTQEQIQGLMVIPQIVNQPIQLIEAPNMHPNAPFFMTFLPWSTAFNQFRATSAGEVDTAFVQESSQTGPGTGMIPEIPRTSPIFVQPTFSAGLRDFPAPRAPLPVPIPNGPLLTRIGTFPGTQPGPLPIMPLQPFLGRPGIIPRDLPFGLRMMFPLRPQPFVLG
ncbi:hypothetical protein CHS0354_003458 [Potamilus streckersoni]|nr:hypothetical protein CHS0354_003458 [Potamilus streckersoni]